jgi:uncharacterized protein
MNDGFHIMVKPIGPICNLDCKYCFYLEKENLYPSAEFRMKPDVLEEFIKQQINSQTADTVIFSWQGGEPTLLGVDYFKMVTELQYKYSNGKKIKNTFQTNGIMLDDDWCDFFLENDFLVGLSIDGPQEVHDVYRINKGGGPSFNQVERGLEYLKKHKVEFNTLTVVHDINSARPIEVYNFLKEIGSLFMQFIPIVERKAIANHTESLSLVSPDYVGRANVTDWSVKPENYGNFLIRIFDEWVRKDVGRYFVQIFDVALESWYGKIPSLCIFRETCGDALALAHTGDLYSCDHYVYPENKLGNIMNEHISKLVKSSEQIIFGEAKKDKLPKFCQECEVKFACNGECPKHRFELTPDGEEGLNYLCAGYKRFFNYIDPYMRVMADEIKNGRDPAHIMNWAREKDKGFPSFNLKRNDKCPCGSGKKYKYCCHN